MAVDEVRALSLQLGAGVHAVMASLVRRLEADPDAAVVPLLDTSLEQARRMAVVLVRQSWAAGGGSPSSPRLAALVADAERAFGDFPGQLQGILAEARPAAAAPDVRTAVGALVTRVQMSLEPAAAFSRTEAVLEEGMQRLVAGEKVMKAWRSRLSPRTCRWCRELNGMLLPLAEEFPHGEPAVLPQRRTRHVATPAGARHYHRSIGQPIIFTHPPRVYQGTLPGPPRHYRCFCWLELVTVRDEAPPERSVGPSPAEPSYLRASDIAALPEAQYRSLFTFLQAAVHELGQLLSRLRGLHG